MFLPSVDGERLRSHSAIRFDAVRAIFEGLNLVRAGQGMPSDTLVSGIESVSAGCQSPKLFFSIRDHRQKT